MTFFDFVNQIPVTSDFVVRPCAKMDVLCANPLGPTATPDENGVATITVPSGFDGYAEIVSGSGTTVDGAVVAKYVPTMVFFNPPPIEDSANSMTAMFSPEAFAALAESNESTIDSTLGSLFSGALDCKGSFSAGVSLETDRTVAATRKFYYVDGLPNFAAATTDSSGYGGLINLPTGTIRLSAKVGVNGPTIGAISAFIRPGYISQVDLVPSP
jgi:hypothetical protein